MNKLNARNEALSISTFDFSTFYTKIPHGKLINVINKLIDFCFAGGECQYVVLTRYGAKWVENVNTSWFWFDKLLLRKAIKYILDNFYFTVGDHLFRQHIGISMGFDPAPFHESFLVLFRR